MLNLNPFHDDYASETTSPSDFVKLFSPVILQRAPDVTSLFRNGNVVLTGLQGSGKSMLLALLAPETRIAFDCANQQLPVADEVSNFISAGINLTQSGAAEFGQRMDEGDPDASQKWPLFFGDFVNYWIVRDLLNNLVRLKQPDATSLSNKLNLKLEDGHLDSFARDLAIQECWHGYLKTVTSFKTLLDAIQNRIRFYRNYLNFNCDMEVEVSSTKTTAGQPISDVANFLRKHEVISPATQVFVRIDQYEELLHLEEWSRSRKLYTDYRAIIHKMVGRRDGSVHYRIGTRRYAWPESPQMYSTSAVAEHLRNYTEIDLDDTLRRKENVKWIFPDFVEDVFRRRLIHAGYESASIADVYGPPTKSEDRVKHYVSDASKVVDCDASWPIGCCESLQLIAATDVLSAKLGEAHLRQNLRRGTHIDAQVLAQRPWEERTYWKKERIDQALLQVAAAGRQKMIWYGSEDILELSAGNVLTFLDLCKVTWASWMRSTRVEDEPSNHAVPRFENPYSQSEGVLQVSTHWFEKIRASENGDSRMRFARTLGGLFRLWLREDKTMSYPGYNGFSIAAKDLEEYPDVKQFLNDATAFGVLVWKRHTSRSRNRESHKWYLHPILSPYFQIPASHRKEPKETTIEELLSWISKDHVLITVRKSVKKPMSTQKTLFDFDAEE